MLKKSLLCLLCAVSVVLPGQIPAAADQEVQPVRMLLEFDDASKLDQINGNASYSLTDQNCRLYGSTLSMATSDKDVFVGTQEGLNLDATGYNYLNLWVFTPREVAARSTLNLLVFSGGSTKNTSYYPIPIDWRFGWRLVSIPLDSLSKVNGTEDLSNIYMLRLNVNGYANMPGIVRWTEEVSLCIDNLFLSVEQPKPFVVEALSPSPGMLLPAADAEIKARFSSALVKDGPAPLEFWKGGKFMTEGWILEYPDPRTAAARLEGGPDFGAAYTMRVPKGLRDAYGQDLEGESEWSFSGQAEALTVGRIRMADSSGEPAAGLVPGGPLTASATAYQPAGASAAAALWLAAYDEAGYLTRFEKAVPEAGASGEVLLTAGLVPEEGEACIRAFAASEDGCSLLREEFIEITPSGASETVWYQPAEGQRQIRMDQLGMEIDRLGLSGNAEGLRTVLVSVLDSDNELVFLTPIAVQPDWSFHYECTFKGESDTYTARASGVEAKGKDGIFEYADSRDQQSLLEEINQASSAAALETLLEERGKQLGLTGLGTTERAGIASVVWEQKPYSSYKELRETADLTVLLLQKLNGCPWSDLSDLLATHAGLLLKGDTYSRYQGLSSKKRQVVNQETMKHAPFAGLLEFRREFSAAVEREPDALSPPGNGGGGGGGGGTRVNRPAAGTGSYEVTRELVPKAPFAEQTAPDPSGPELSKPVFLDLGEAPWAAEAVGELTRLGIVAAPEDGKFRPGDAVTREEFVKLLVGAFQLPLSEEVCTFSDVEPDGWYLPYLAAAQSCGMVYGDENGRFGIGEQISRQDLAVMAERTVRIVNRGWRRLQEQNPFLDLDTVSEYAKEAVVVMQSAGVLSGTGDGCFRPLSPASRAEAAVVIDNLLGAMEEGSW